MLFGLEDFTGLVVEDGDELVADGFAFLLGIGDALEAAKETIGRVNGDDAQTKPLAHGLLNFGKLILAKDAVVDEDAGETFADGARDENGGDARVHTARETADGVALANLGANALDGRLDELLGRPVGRGSADVEDEVAKQFHALTRVRYLRMKLDGPDTAGLIRDAGESVWGLRRDAEARGKTTGLIAVAHPDGE